VNGSRCRDTYVQRLLDAGAREENVSVIIGHRSLTTTRRHYGRPLLSNAMEDVKRIWESEKMKNNGEMSIYRKPASAFAAAVGEREGIRTRVLNGADPSQNVIHLEFPRPHFAYVFMIYVQRLHHCDNRLPVPAPESFQRLEFRLFVSGFSVEQDT